MNKHKLNRRYLVLFLLVIALTYSLQYNKILFYPSNLQLVKGENKNLDISFPFSIEKSETNNLVSTIFNEGDNHILKSYNLTGMDAGESQLKVKLLGLIAVKNYNVNVIDRPEYIIGGNSIGVRLNTKGVLVVAVTDVIDISGKRISPAKDAGIKVGDSVIAINGEKIINAEQVVEILNKTKNEELEITILRNKNEFQIKTRPVQCLQDNSFRLGIWVRDKTSGIGTLTYYDPETNRFAALGHGIADADTGKLLTVEKGLILNAKISDIEQGRKGAPGEIRGVFYKTDEILGNIYDNNSFGIYGVLSDHYVDNMNSSLIPIGFKEEVVEGKAHILTTLEDNIVEKYEIEIIKVEQQLKPNQKSMIIRITDPKLLEKTGGIVQGMSGSPIIQNDRLIGAVTHVFVNDPTKGYGLYIEWMDLEKDKF